MHRDEPPPAVAEFRPDAPLRLGAPDRRCAREGCRPLGRPTARRCSRELRGDRDGRDAGPVPLARPSSGPAAHCRPPARARGARRGRAARDRRRSGAPHAGSGDSGTTTTAPLPGVSLPLVADGRPDHERPDHGPHDDGAPTTTTAPTTTAATVPTTTAATTATTAVTRRRPCRRRRPLQPPPRRRPRLHRRPPRPPRRPRPRRWRRRRHPRRPTTTRRPVRALYFGTYDRAHPRNVNAIAALRADGGRDRRAPGGRASHRRRTRHARVLGAETRLLAPRRRDFDLVIVGYPGTSTSRGPGASRDARRSSSTLSSHSRTSS